MLIIGLGNPGREYKWTRHNVGYEAVDKLAYDHKIEIGKSKFKGKYGEGYIGKQKVMLLKPCAYMNLSGEVVRSIMGYYNIAPKDILVIFDDVSLKLGEIRIRLKGSAGGHNGIKNIIQHLGTDEFMRIKIGVDPKPPDYDLADYVLSKFKKTEDEIIIQSITKATDAVEEIIKNGTEKAMNIYN